MMDGLRSRLDHADRRTWPRMGSRFDAWVTLEQSNTVVRGRTTNISSGGVYLCIPPAVATELMGSKETRLNVRVILPAADPVASGKSLVNCGARLVHSELLLDESDCQIGLGLEFDRPQVIMHERVGQAIAAGSAAPGGSPGRG
jgi:hypothetical protein